MRSMFCLPSALAIALLWASPAWAAPRSKSASSSSRAHAPSKDSSKDNSKKSGKEISTDDRALDKQMDWETKVLGPNTVKKIDLAKIQKLQAEELARRERQEKIDQADKDRKEREAAAAEAAQRNVKAPSTRELPAIPEPAPAKPVEKHDDAFVDKLLTGKGERKKVAVSNDDVDQLLNKVKQEKSPGTSAKGRGKGADNVDQLLATADKQASIKTTVRKPADAPEAMSAEAAAREATLKAIAAAAAQAQEERARKRLAIPDGAVLRAQAAARTQNETPNSSSSRSETPKATASRAAWSDPFASDGPSSGSSKARSKGTPTTTVPSSSSRPPASAAGRHPPATRPSENDTWKDPFDSGGGGAKPRNAPSKAAPAARPGKHPPNWKDPFA